MTALPIPREQMAAIGISIAVHAVAVLGMSTLKAAPSFVAEPATAIFVTLVEAPPRATPRPTPAAPRPPEERRPEPSASGSKSAPVEPARAPLQHAAAAPATKGEPEESAPRPWPLPIASASNPPAAQPSAPAAPANGPAEDPLAEYKRRVWAQLAAHAPAAAPGSGVATAVLGLDESGAILFVRLARSSGQPAFDRACLKAIRAASPLPKPPAGVGRDALVFEVPIRARSR